MVLLVLLLIAAGVAVLIWQPWRGAAAPSATPSVTPAAATPAVTEATPTPASDSGESPVPTPTPTAVATACTTADITVLAETDKDAYGADEQPRLSITLSNEGEVPCLIDVGTAMQRYEITSGSDTWWRSTDCQTEPNNQVVELAAGQTVSSQEPLVWDRTRSSAGTCAEGESRQRAGSGTYHLEVSIGGIEAADTRAFVLN